MKSAMPAASIASTQEPAVPSVPAVDLRPTGRLPHAVQAAEAAAVRSADRYIAEQHPLVAALLAGEPIERPAPADIRTTEGLTAAVTAIVTELLRAHLDADSRMPASPRTVAAYAAIAEGVNRAEVAVGQERRPATHAATTPERDYADHLFGEAMSAMDRAIKADSDPASAGEVFANWARYVAAGAAE